MITCWKTTPAYIYIYILSITRGNLVHTLDPCYTRESLYLTTFNMNRLQGLIKLFVEFLFITKCCMIIFFFFLNYIYKTISRLGEQKRIIRKNSNNIRIQKSKTRWQLASYYFFLFENSYRGSIMWKWICFNPQRYSPLNVKIGTVLDWNLSATMQSEYTGDVNAP